MPDYGNNQSKKPSGGGGGRGALFGAAGLFAAGMLARRWKPKNRVKPRKLVPENQTKPMFQIHFPAAEASRRAQSRHKSEDHPLTTVFHFIVGVIVTIGIGLLIVSIF